MIEKLQKTLELLNVSQGVRDIVFVFFVLISILIGIFKLIPPAKEKIIQIKKWWADKSQFRSAKKQAIEKEVEYNVNEIVTPLSKEFPPGWIKKLSIDWVDNKKTISELEEGEVVLRMKPRQNQDDNFVSAINHFFDNVLFPNSKEVIPEEIKKASSLHLSRRTIKDKDLPFLDKLKNDYLEPAIQDNENLATYLEKLNNIDKKGFFSGTFIRETDKLAKEAQFNSSRQHVEEEISSILSHIENFIKLKDSDEDELVDENWKFQGVISNYAYILVAHPRIHNIKVYINKAKQRKEEGIKRLYVFGVNSRKKFAKKVIRKLDSKTSYKLKELYNLNKDYRGKDGGVCALLTQKES